MEGGILVVRGAAGQRIGGGMQDGLIVVHGDVGADPGAGMQGGRIIINGRCPTPPPGVVLRPLSAKEVKEINILLDDETLHVPGDAVCLTPQEGLNVESFGHTVSAGDLSQVGLLGYKNPQLPSYATVDTVALVGISEEVQSLALPLPMLPFVETASSMETDATGDEIAMEVLNRHPVMTSSEPRPVDVLLIRESNLLDVGEKLPTAGGFGIDFDNLPNMNAEEIDGFLVALRSLAKEHAPVIFVQGISRIQSLHQRAEYHSADVAMARIEDGSGISEAAALPMTGRSKKANITTASVQTGFLLGFAANGHDLAVLVASGANIVSCEAPMADGMDIAYWLQGTQEELAQHLRRIGVDSIDLLDRSHLRALDHETAAVSGLRLSGYDRPLPHWFAR
tara:strand:- start:14160 stop:15344 length:1185 start_codon:yes stop_codon:yes gene_type:complete